MLLAVTLILEKRTITYIISNIDKALAFEWIAEAEALQDTFEVSFILLNEKEGYLYQFLTKGGHTVKWIQYRGKKDMLSTTWQLYRYLIKKRIDIVHTHLFDAGIAGLLAARLAGVPKRIYTRHHATMHHTYYPRAVYYDRFINSLATHVVAISENVKEVLQNMEHVAAHKIVLIHHGFDLNFFKNVPQERASAVMRRHRISEAVGPRIGIISRYIHLKGIEYIIEAFREVRRHYPKVHLILANARGDYQSVIKEKLQQLPGDSYTEIEFESDLPALYKTFDVYVHTPIDSHSEAFGQTYVEALAAGVPSVFTLSGVAAEFIKDRQSALVVPFKDAGAIADGILELLSDAKLQQEIVANGYAAVAAEFSVEGMIDKLMDLYTSK